MSNSTMFNLIKQINDVIYNYCLDGLLDKMDTKYNLYQKIRNMTLLLQSNALRIVTKKPQLFTHKLSLEETKEFLVKTYEIVTTYSSTEIEDNITKLIQTYALDLDELWSDNSIESKEYREIQDILHEIL